MAHTQVPIGLGLTDLVGNEVRGDQAGPQLTTIDPHTIHTLGVEAERDSQLDPTTEHGHITHQNHH